MKHLLLLSFLVCSWMLRAQDDAVVLKSNTETVIKNNKLTRSISYVILINNVKGEELTQVSINSSNLLKVSRITANITDISGKEIKKLRSSDIQKHKAYSEVAFFDDNMVQEFSLRHNRYPYIFQYSYQEEAEQFLYVDYWSPVVAREIPTNSATLQITVPLDYKINYRSTQNEVVHPDTVDGQLRYRWTMSYMPLPTPEKYSPLLLNLYPSVKVVPLQFRFEENGSMADWQTYGNWEYKLISSRQDITPEEQFKIDNLVNGVKDSMEMVRILYHYLQDGTRYINVSEKTGGMVPHPANYVCVNKFGDCKALSNYMIAILKHLGIRGIYCSTYAGNKLRTTDRSFPSQQTNHVIVCVPLRKDSIWLDCTTKLPFNYLGTFTQGRTAMLTEKDCSRLVQTPSLGVAQVKCTRNIQVSENEEKQVSVKFENTYRGDDFEDIAYRANSSEDEKDRFIRNSVMDNGMELVNYEIVRGNRDSTHILVRYKATTKTIFTCYGNDIVLKTISLPLPHFEKPAMRKYPVALAYPICYEDRQEYVLGDQKTIHTLPEKTVIQSPYGVYSCAYQMKENTLIVSKQFTLFAGAISLKQYPEFFGFVNGAYEKEKSTCLEVMPKP